MAAWAPDRIGLRLRGGAAAAAARAAGPSPRDCRVPQGRPTGPAGSWAGDNVASGPPSIGPIVKVGVSTFTRRLRPPFGPGGSSLSLAGRPGPSESGDMFLKMFCSLQKLRVKNDFMLRPSWRSSTHLHKSGKLKL
jgi:hypothetical protein